MPRILAVDWGERRIGLAVSDPTGLIATGLDTLVVTSAAGAARGVAAIAGDVDAERIVVGLPLLLSGEAGEAAGKARAFADRLRECVAVPVDTYDERLTSALSERRLRDASSHRGSGERSRKARAAGRGSRDKGAVDRGAAVALLESYLLYLRNRTASGE